MELSYALKLGSKRAVEMVKSVIQNPMLISKSPAWAISLEVEAITQTGQAEVSERAVIVPGSGVKSYLNDNVAPGAWTWQMSGWIPGDPLAEPTNLFTPIVMMNVFFLRKAYKNGSRIIFKDVDQMIYKNCVIQSLSIDTKSECKNKKPFSMTLKEIVELKATISDKTDLETLSEAKNTIEDKGITTASTVDFSQSILSKAKDGIVSFTKGIF